MKNHFAIIMSNTWSNGFDRSRSWSGGMDFSSFLGCCYGSWSLNIFEGRLIFNDV